MVGFTPGSFVQGMEAGQDRANKQEALKMQKVQMGQATEAHNMNMKTQANANYEMDLIKASVEEEKKNLSAFKKSVLTDKRTQVFDGYIDSIPEDTFMTGKFGGDIKLIQDFSRLVDPDKGVPQAPNPNSDEQRAQLTSLLAEENPDMASWELEGLVDIEMASGEYIATADGKLVGLDALMGTMGHVPSSKARAKLDSFMQAKNSIGLASKGKYGGEEAEPMAQQMNTYLNQIGDPSLTDAQRDAARTNLSLLTKEGKISKAFATSYTTSNANKAFVKSVAEGHPTNEDSIRLNIDMETQAGKLLKPSDKLYMATKGELAVYQQVNDLVAEMAALAPEEMSAGVADELKRNIATAMSDKDFAKMLPEAQMRLLARGKFTSKAGTIFAKFVKNISGSAVADAEFARLAKLFFGGSEGVVNVQTMMNSMSGFAEASKVGIVKEAKINASIYPGQMGDVLMKVNNTEAKTVGGKEIIEQMGSGKKDLDTATTETITKPITTAIDEGKKKINNFLGFDLFETANGVELNGKPMPQEEEFTKDGKTIKLVGKEVMVKQPNGSWKPKDLIGKEPEQVPAMTEAETKQAIIEQNKKYFPSIKIGE